jgi:hypothetical protein
MKTLASLCRVPLSLALAGLVGVGASARRGDEHLLAAPRTPMANLFRSIAAKDDIELDTFGDSTGSLEI